MRYPASEKMEIIRLVEQSHLGVGSTLDKLGIPKTTFYRWYDRFLAFGDAGLEDRNSSPGRVWNRIPDDVRGQIIDLAPGGDATVAPGTGRQVYGHQGLLCLGSLGLPASQGPRPDHQPRFRGHQGSR